MGTMWNTWHISYGTMWNYSTWLMWLKINHLNMIDYVCDVTFEDMEILKCQLINFWTKLLKEMKVNYGCHVLICCL